MKIRVNNLSNGEMSYYGTKKWCCKVFKKYNMLGYERYFNESLNSLEEAVEEALKYCLTELI